MKHMISCAKYMPLIASCLVLFILTTHKALAETSHITINAFKVGSTKEYVELRNTSDEIVSINQWKLTYTNSSGANLRTLALPTGDLAGGGSLIYVSSDYRATLDASLQEGTLPLLYSGLADSGGFLHLYMPVEVSLDYPDGYQLVEKVGWSSSSATPSDVSIINLPSTSYAQRCTDLLGVPARRDNNQTDFSVSSVDPLLTISSLCGDLVVEPPGEEDPPDEEDPEDPVEIQTSCLGIRINELLPNPSGDDVSLEYIELLNPTDEAIELQGCSVRVGGSTQTYPLTADAVVEPGGYLTISDTTSGITLPNASGARVYLVDMNGVEVSEMNYPGDLDNDQSWALFGTLQQATYEPTPGLENILLELKPCEPGLIRSPDTNRCEKVPKVVTAPITCSTDQYINPDTGRCKKLETASEPAPCREGQERNLETNRCRTTVVLSASLVPCQTGQERNPETNRCRSIVLASSSLTECREGQERNLETNRCRTTVSDAPLITVSDVPSEQSPSADWVGVLTVMVLACGYSVYEWRAEIGSKLGKAFRTRQKSV
jgi:hypothetical protein